MSLDFTLKDLQLLASSSSVLYVEDEDILRDTVSMYLSKFFKYVASASNGQEALDMYEKDKFDLIITDIAMPKLDGLEMSKIIKSQDPFQIILIVSAYSDPEYFNQSIKIGIDGYILKPLDYDQMNIILYKVLTQINNRKELIKLKNCDKNLLIRKRK